MSIEMIKAVEEHAEPLGLILNQALARKLAHDDHGWGEQPFVPDDIARIIAAGDTYLAAVDDKFAGSLQVIYEDPRVWGSDKGNDGLAVYVHRVATADAFSGQGMVRPMLNWAADHAAETGRLHVRLDCNLLQPNVHSLLNLYERNLFWYIGSRVVSNTNTAALLERRA